MNTPDYNEHLKTTGRNDPCPCGSGKKYKKCHLAEDEEAKRLELARAAKERESIEATAETDAKSPSKLKNPNAKSDFHVHREKSAPSQGRKGNLPRRGAI